MAAACPQCGESLIGAVNRCWKCGCSFQQPYRRADDKQPAETVSPPPPSAPAEAPVLATLADASPKEPPRRHVGLEGFAAPVSPLRAAVVPPPATAWIGPSPGEPKFVSREVVRRGSPFDPRCVPKPPARNSHGSAPIGSTRSVQDVGLAAPHAALGGVWSAMVLGVFGLLLSFWRFEGALVALVGFGMGIWGLQSQRRQWAFAALLICTLALMLGTYTGVLTLDRELKRMYGQSAGFLAP